VREIFTIYLFFLTYVFFISFGSWYNPAFSVPIILVRPLLIPTVIAKT